ncbi:MAG: glycosyltransferase family 39 protein [Chloroflexi bacterium]|nr:glycosyltransferase family 39 protein [Chloroflexota bacterium]
MLRIPMIQEGLAQSEKAQETRGWAWQSMGPLLLVFLLAFALRVYDLASLSLQGDYAYSVYAARQDLVTIARERVLDGHPPLYYYLLHFWMLLAGQSELATRMLSVLIGVLAVPLTYIIGKHIMDRRVGMLGSLFVAASPALVHYSRMPRMYILLATLALASACALAIALQRDRRQDWLAYFIATSLLIYTHYYGLALVLAEAVYVVFLHRRADRRLFHCIIAGGAAGIVFLPWLFFAALTSARVTAGIISNAPWPQDVQGIVEQYWIPLNVGDYLSIGIARPMALALFVVWVLALAAGRHGLRRRWRVLSLPVCAVAVPIAASLVVFVFMPYAVRPRFLIFCIPPYLLLLAAVLRDNRRWLTRAGVSIALVASAYALLGLYQAEPYVVEDDAITLTEYVEKVARPEEAVVFQAFWQIGYFTTHYKGKAPTTYSLRDLSLEDAKAILPRYPRVWLAMYQTRQRDPAYPLEEWLDTHWYKSDEVQIGPTRLIAYVPPTQDGWQDTAFEFDARENLPILRLTAAQQRRSTAQPGDAVAVGLRWQALRSISERYTVFLQLVDAGGRRWAGADREPLGGSEPTAGWQEGKFVEDRIALVVPAAIPPGDYTLRVGLYPTGDPQPLLAKGPGGSIAGGGAPIGEVRVGGVNVEDLKMRHSLGQRLGDGIVLLGYDLDIDSYQLESTSTLTALTDNPIKLSFPKRTYRPSDTVEITLYWQALRSLDRDYTVFVHLADNKGKPWGQADSQPLGGAYPTSRWRSGEVVVDKYSVRIDPTTPPGDYHPRVGMYLLSTMERLPVAGSRLAGDTVELQSIKIDDGR